MVWAWSALYSKQQHAGKQQNLQPQKCTLSLRLLVESNSKLIIFIKSAQFKLEPNVQLVSFEELFQWPQSSKRPGMLHAVGCASSTRLRGWELPAPPGCKSTQLSESFYRLRIEVFTSLFWLLPSRPWIATRLPTAHQNQPRAAQAAPEKSSLCSSLPSRPKQAASHPPKPAASGGGLLSGKAPRRRLADGANPGGSPRAAAAPGPRSPGPGPPGHGRAAPAARGHGRAGSGAGSGAGSEPRRRRPQGPAADPAEPRVPQSGAVFWLLGRRTAPLPARDRLRGTLLPVFLSSLVLRSFKVGCRVSRLRVGNPAKSTWNAGISLWSLVLFLLARNLNQSGFKII